MKEIRLLTPKQVKRIYRKRLKKDFPADELRPLKSIKGLTKRGEYEPLGLFDGSTLLGYAFFVKSTAMYSGNELLLDYFAISKEHRGEGIGTQFLGLLENYFADTECVLCEVEDPAKAPDLKTMMQRGKRLDFYIKNGFSDTGARAKTFGVDFILLEAPNGKTHDAESAAAIYSRLYRKMIGDKLFAKHIVVG